MEVTILTEIREGNVAVITLNRPEKRNALCCSLIENLNQAFGKLDGDATVRAIVLTGAESGPFSGTS